MKKSCVKLSTKKYTSRPSPPYSATSCPGKTLQGNDGFMYKSTMNKAGIYQWKKKGSKKKGSKLFKIFSKNPYSRYRKRKKEKKAHKKMKQEEERKIRLQKELEEEIEWGRNDVFVQYLARDKKPANIDTLDLKTIIIKLLKRLHAFTEATGKSLDMYSRLYSFGTIEKLSREEALKNLKEEYDLKLDVAFPFTEEEIYNPAFDQKVKKIDFNQFYEWDKDVLDLYGIKKL